MKWEDYRKKAGNRAGGWFLTGNIGLAAKNFYDNRADISGILEEPDDLIAAGVFFYAAYQLKKYGHTNKGVFIGQSAACAAYTILMLNAFSEGKIKSGIGASIGVLATAWTGLTALNKMLKKEDKKESFEDNKKGIFKEYPLLPSAMIKFASNVAFIVGNALDGQIFYSFIGGIWATATAHLGISKQENEENSIDKKTKHKDDRKFTKLQQ